MAEDYENFEARLVEAHRAVERWDAEGEAREAGRLVEQAPDAAPDGESPIPPGESGEATHDRGEATER
jgi:hypothetical protein